MRAKLIDAAGTVRKMDLEYFVSTVNIPVVGGTPISFRMDKVWTEREWAGGVFRSDRVVWKSDTVDETIQEWRDRLYG